MIPALFILAWIGLVIGGTWFLYLTQQWYDRDRWQPPADDQGGDDDTKIECGVCSSRPRDCNRVDCPFKPGSGGSKCDKRLQNVLKEFFLIQSEKH